MGGREFRAGLAFVLISLTVGAAVRGWQRGHEVRFASLVESLVEGDLADREREAAAPPAGATAPGPTAGSRAKGAPRGSSDPGEGRGRAAAPSLRPASLDVDRASVEEWIRLPGIGPALAARIVSERAVNGPFGSPEGLLRVPGIGAKTLAKIRPFLAPPGEAAPGAP